MLTVTYAIGYIGDTYAIKLKYFLAGAVHSSYSYDKLTEVERMSTLSRCTSAGANSLTQNPNPDPLKPKISRL